MNRTMACCTSLLIALALRAAAQPAAGGKRQPVIRALPFVQATMAEAGRSFPSARTRRVAVLADRHVYFADEMHGQFLAMFLGKVAKRPAAGSSIRVDIRRSPGTTVATLDVAPVRGPKLPVLVAMQRLAPGRYELSATLRDATGRAVASAARAFTKSAKRTQTPAIPAQGIPIRVHAQGHLPDAAWPVSTGVPMPKATLTDCADLVLLENGKAVPAQCATRATWTPQGYVKWLGLDFLARYDRGTPRAYRLVRRPGPHVRPRRPLTVRRDADRITVDTGSIRFVVSRKSFAGIEEAWLDRNADGVYGDDERVVHGPGGSCVVDDKGVRYESCKSRDVEVAVEEAGPVCVGLVAKGAYASRTGGELCRFVVRIRAYAGQASLHISHRMVNTIPDLYVSTRLADVGFELTPEVPIEEARFGLDDTSYVRKLGAEGHSVSLHQDRGDHVRLLAGGKRVAEGKRSSGWMSVATGRGSATVFLRDVYQKFPKELEATFGRAPGPGKLVVHFWPRHGHRAFSEAEELARDQIYKVRWAHQGRLLDMRIPGGYHKRLEELQRTEHWAGGGELILVDRKRKLTKMQASGGQGTVIGNELFLRFDAERPDDAALSAWARLCQQSPHAAADPAWSCATLALGPVAPRDPDRFGPAERLLDSAGELTRRAIIEAGDENGMWIHGGVHNNWMPGIHAPNMKRVWQMSHYQNVFQAWMLYFRSGLATHLEWARIHSDQHMDVGVCNYRKYPKGKHSYSHIGEMGGGIYHCKGFMPWAGNNSTYGHWIDISNYFVRYYMTGDRRGLDMAARWMATINKMKGSNQPELGDPKRVNPREVLVPLGEVVWYYEGTWDPQALIRLDALALNLDIPFVKTNSPSLSAFGKHWQDWYYDLARDPRVIARIKEFLDDREYHSTRRPAYYAFAAFLYHATGDASHLRACVPQAYDATLNVYDKPGDRYHLYSRTQSNPASMFLGRLPFFLHALNAAGVEFAPATDRSVMPCRGGRVDRHDKWVVPPRGWTNAGMAVLARAEEATKLKVVVDGPKQFGSFRGHYMLFHGFPRLNVPGDRRQMARLRKQQIAAVVRFPDPTVFKDPPEQRSVGAGRGPSRQRFPYVQEPENDRGQRLYHLAYSGDNIDLPVLFDAETGRALPQVAVIPRTLYWNAQPKESTWRIKGAARAFMRALDLQAVIRLNVRSVHKRYWMPTTVRITDAKGNVVIDTSVFMAGERKQVDVALNPAANPPPWRVEMASSGDCEVRFQGAPELFFAVRPEDFGAVLPHLSGAGKGTP